MRRFVQRLLNLVRQDAEDRELAREISAHLALLEDAYLRRGMTPAEASRAARLAIGGVERTKDLHRDARAFTWIDDARRDAVHATRILRRNPLFTLTAALSLAIGIGANTAIFTVANALLFKDPAGVVEPGRLVDIGGSRGDGGLNPASYNVYRHVRERSTVLESVYAQQMFPHAMSLGEPGARGPAERVFAHAVTTTYFPAVGAVPAIGRLFAASDDDGGGASAITVLSYRFWMRRFRGDPAAVGATIRLNGEAFTIVGVTAQPFTGTGIVAPDIWTPLNLAGSQSRPRLAERGAGGVFTGGRLKAGISMAQAAEEIAAVGQTINRDYPQQAIPQGLRLLPASRAPGNQFLIALFFGLLMAVVGVVLAVACANVAGVLLARGAARRRELAVRLAIGAGRMRLVRQLLTETVMLFALGGCAGLFLGRATMSIVVPLLPSLPFPVAVPLTLDGRVFAFTAVLSLVAALLSGLAPALQAQKADVSAALKSDSLGRSHRSRLRSTFVVAQVTFSLVLVATAGLFLRALQQAGSTNPGFNPTGVELATIDLGMSEYTDSTGPRFWRDVVDQVRRLPNVQSATAARVLPGGFEGIGLGGVSIPGAASSETEGVAISWNIVEPGYFATLEIPIVAGRDFERSDVTGAPLVTIVSEQAARRLWPGQIAVGRYLSMTSGAAKGTPIQVVGVARDLKSSSLIDGLADSYVYLPLQQHYSSDMTSTMTIAARSKNGERLTTELRSVVTASDPDLAIVTSQTLRESTALGLVPQRIVASVSGSLGGVALLLAAIGIYGVTAYTVARRTREIGIRIALGAARRDILTMVLRQGMLLAVVGSVAGLCLAAVVSRLLSGFLFGVPPLDTPTFAGTAALFVAVGLAACYLPARRAATIDPLVALRDE
jgi:predicted permease